MRNLKRALSMALAAIMVLGLMVVGASAASYEDFTDKDEIVNKEAVNTMVSLGVISGKDNGAYDPTGSLTRAEACTLIARMLGGGKDPVLGSNITSNFTDTKGHWAETYIAYCANLGIIVGVGDGSFNPDGTLTGTAAAKMVLCALGYKPEFEGIGGANWELATNTLATKVKLYEGLETLNPSETITRDQVAQLIYNGVQAQEVEYRNLEGDYQGTLYAVEIGTMLANRFKVVKVEGIVVANDVFGVPGFSATPNGRVRLEDTNTYTTTGSNGQAVTKNYNGVYSVDMDNDMVGTRVVIYVQFKNALAPNAAESTVIGTPISSDKNTIAVTTNRMSDGNAVRDFLSDNDLALNSKRTQAASSSNDGYYVGTLTFTKNDTVAGTSFDRNFAATGSTKQKGIEFKFIDHDDDGVVDYIFRTEPTMAKVTVYNETDKELTIAGLGSVDFDDIANYSDVAKDDIVLYYLVNETYYLTKAESVSGKVTAYDNEAKTLTMDGTAYSQSALNAEVSSTDMTNLTIADANGDSGMDFVGNTYTFYLDASGNVVTWVLGDESLGNYAIVLENEVTGSTFRSAKVKLLMADGTTGTYSVNLLSSANRFDLSGSTSAKETDMLNMMDSTAGNTVAGTDTAAGLKNTIVSYAIGDDGNVTIGNPALAGNYAATTGGDAATRVTRSAGGYKMTSAEGVANTTIKVNDSTLFFIRNVSETTADPSEDDVYTVVKGVSNLPTKDIVLKSDNTGYATAENAIYTTTDANNLVAKAVFVDGYFKGTANYVYVTSSYTGTTTINGERVYTYPVVFENGEAGTLNISDDAVAKDMVYEYTVDSNGVADVERTASTINNVVSTYSRGSNLTLANGDGRTWDGKDDVPAPNTHTYTNAGPAYTIAYGAQLWNVEGTPYKETLTDSMSMAVVLDGDGFVKTVFVNDTNATKTEDANVTFDSSISGLSLEYAGANFYSGYGIQVKGGAAGQTISYTVTYDNGKTANGTATFANNAYLGHAVASISVPANAKSIKVTAWSANPNPSATPTFTAGGSDSAATVDANVGGKIASVTATGSNLKYQWYKMLGATPADTDTKLTDGTDFTGTTTNELSLVAGGAEATALKTPGTALKVYCVVTSQETGKDAVTATSGVFTVTHKALSQDNVLDVYSTAAEINAEMVSAKEKGLTEVSISGNSNPDARIDIPAGMTLKVTGDFTDDKGIRFGDADSKLVVDGQYIFGSTNVGSIGNVEAGSVLLNKNATVNGTLTTGAITSAVSESLTVATGATLTADSVAQALISSGTTTVTGNVGGALTVNAGTATVGTVTGAIDVKSGATLNLTENTTFAASSSIAGTATVAEGKTATVSSALTVTGTLTVDTLTASANITGAGKLVVGTFSNAATGSAYAQTTTVQVTKAATAATLEAIPATDGHTLIIDVKSSDTTSNTTAANAKFFEAAGDGSTEGTPALDSDYIKAGTYHAATDNVYTDGSGTTDTAWLMETVAP